MNVQKISCPVTIKTILDGDLKGAMHFLESVLGELIRTYSYIRRHYRKASDLFIGAYMCKELIGAIFGYKIRNYVLIGELGVKEEYRRQGIGSSLVSELLNRAKKLGVKYIIAGSTEEAENFYLNIGFKPYLFVQVMSENLPKNFKSVGFRVIGMSRRKNSVGLLISVDKISSIDKERAKRIFNAYNVLYLFEKRLD